MLISHSHRFIFFHVAKTGGLSVRQALEPFAEEPSHFRIQRPVAELDGKPNPLRQVWDSMLLHATAQDAQRLLAPEIFNHYYKFAFVRNPWDWQVSMYHFILREPGHIRHHLVRSLGSFDAYLDWVITTPRPYPKGALKLQSAALVDGAGALLVDWVGRYERLEPDFYALTERLGIRVALPHLNRTAHQDYRTLYTPEARAKVAEHFAADIDLFGYTFDGVRE